MSVRVCFIGVLRDGPCRNRDHQEEGMKEESDEMVPEGVEEVELARIRLEQTQRECRLLIHDLQTLHHSPLDENVEEIQVPAVQEGVLWMISGARATVVHTYSHPTLYLLQHILFANLRHHGSSTPCHSKPYLFQSKQLLHRVKDTDYDF